MQFNTFVFFIFFLLTLVIYYSVSSKYRNLILLISNYIFYSYFDYRFSLLLIGLTSITFFFGNQILKSVDYEVKRKYLIAGLLINILVLFFFKYFNFFSESFQVLFLSFGLSVDPVTIKIIQPLGISFYIFQTLTYLFDAYFDNIKDKPGFIDYLTFASFFPTVVAGPIERAHRLLPQISSERKFEFENLRYGFFLIVQGLFRKVLIGDSIGRMINFIFADPQYYTSLEIIFAILLYSLQIYNDFAGYSNIARGTAKILGFDIYINFKQPYLSESITEFWRRWHISLSLWLRDYIFTPLQLKFRDYKKLGNILAILITFTLCGLWHGPSWTFVLWGFLHGFYMSFALYFDKPKKQLKGVVQNKFLMKIGTIIITYLLITFAWIFFRAENISSAIFIIERITDFTTGEFILRFLKITIAYFIVSFSLDYLELKFNTDAILIKLSSPVRIAVSVITLVVIFSYLLTSDKAPFIYAQF